MAEKLYPDFTPPARLWSSRHAVAAEFAPLAEAKTVALTVAPGPPVAAVGCEDALRILLSNLVDNAIRYTPAGGRIVVGAASEGAEPVLEVADSGPGIPLVEQTRVFDRFYRVPGTDLPGSGLGLAIVKQVADMHHARIELGPGLDGAGLAVRVRFASPDRPVLGRT